MCMDILQKKAISNFKLDKKFTEKRKAYFLIKTGLLIEEGFTLKEALVFLKMIMPKEKVLIQRIITGLGEGHEFHQLLKEKNFNQQITTQLYLAQVHGAFGRTLLTTGKTIEEKITQQQKLKKILSYPLLLMGLMIGIVLAMRILLLPHFEQLFQQQNTQEVSFISRFSIGLILHFPSIFIYFVLGGSLIWFVLNRRLAQLSAIKKTTFFTYVPFLSKMVKHYYTAYFSIEWSHLFKSGCSMQEIIQLMKQKETLPLMQELAMIMEEELSQGKKFNEIFNQFAFFNQEISFIVFHGETTSKLGAELTIYGQDCQKELLEKLEKGLNWIQPLIFMIVAFFILCVYLALLLPMFTMMEGIG